MQHPGPLLFGSQSETTQNEKEKNCHTKTLTERIKEKENRKLELFFIRWRVVFSENTQ